MDRPWDSFFEERPARRVAEMGEWLPTLDVSETKNDIVVKAELPGIDTKDIDISLINDLLTVKGEKSRRERRRRKIFILSKGAMDRLPVRSGFPGMFRATR